ncbi:MAG: adenosylmethionine--8-amino-7-oxononanoate transaminase [Phycisphaerae bacterium]
MKTPDTQTLLQWDRQYVWHPFTPMKAWLEKTDPPIIERGHEEFLFDTQGRKYIDGVSSLWCNVHGHHVPELDQALRDQLDKIAHTTLLGLCNVPSIMLAKRLVEIAPTGLTRVFYSDNGSTAVEVACKLAYQYWVNLGWPEKSRFISLHHAYHGDTLGAVSIGGIPAFQQVYEPLCFPVDRVAPPLLPPFAGTDAAIATRLPAMPCSGNQHWRQDIETLLAQHPGRYAAIVLEPLVQGAGGMLMHPPGTLTLLRQIADQHHLLLICDEVMTGFGRTGKMFACDHEHVTPDLLCLSKGLTAGYMPLGVTLTTAEVFAAFYADPREGKTFFHGHTFTGHPLACAVALASLDLMESRKTLEHARTLAATMEEGLAPLRDHPHVGDMRQTGLVAAVDIVPQRQSDAHFDVHWRIGGELCAVMREQGLILRPLADTLVLMPPLASRVESVEHMTHIVVQAVPKVEDIIRRKKDFQT